jgi:hypothetical protein
MGIPELTTSSVQAMGSVKQYKLEGFPLAVSKAFTRQGLASLASNASLTVRENYVLDELVYTLKVYLLKRSTEPLEVAVEMEPINWYEHLKRDHFPEWFKRRWPVKCKKQYYKIEREIRVCPHSTETWPDPSHIRYITFEED